jgi:hypothetical protein
MKLITYAAIGAAALTAACATPPAADRDITPIVIDGDLTVGGLAALTAMGLDPQRADVVGDVYTFPAFELPEFEESGELDGVLVIVNPSLDASGDVTMDSIAIEDFRVFDKTTGGAAFDRFIVDRPNRALAAYVADIFSGAAGEAGYEIAWRDFTAAEIGVEGLQLAFADELNAETLSGRIDRIAVTDHGGERIGRLEVIGLALQSYDPITPLSMRMGEFSFDDVDLAAMAPIFAAIEAELDDMEMAAVINEATTSQLDIVGAMTVRDLEIGIPDLALSLDSALVETERSGELVRHESAIEGLALTPNPETEGGQTILSPLAMFGYDRIEIRMGGVQYQDEAADRVYTEGPYAIEIVDALRLDLEVDITGFLAMTRKEAELTASGALDESDPLRAAAADAEILSELTITSAALTLTDLSLLDRALAALAAEQGVTPDELRAQAGMFMAMGMMAAPPELPRPLLTDASAALTQFITTGGAVTIAMSPDAPYPLVRIFEEMGAEAFDFDALGLRVTASE